MMRFKMSTLMVILRLGWGGLVSSFYWEHHRRKFFPPPKRAVYKHGMLRWFSQN